MIQIESTNEIFIIYTIIWFVLIVKMSVVLADVSVLVLLWKLQTIICCWIRPMICWCCLYLLQTNNMMYWLEQMQKTQNLIWKWSAQNQQILETVTVNQVLVIPYGHDIAVVLIFWMQFWSVYLKSAILVNGLSNRFW